MRSYLLRVFLFCVVIFTLAQCGNGDNISSKVGIETIPKSPIVFTSKVVSGSKTIEGPWFKFSVKIDNQSDLPLTIMALKATAEIIDDLGNVKSTPITVDPSEYNYTDAAGSPCEYYIFGTINAGGQGVLKLDGPGSCLDYAQVTFYVGGLAKVENNFHYRVTLKPEGFFGSQTDPTQRFEKQIVFYTQ